MAKVEVIYAGEACDDGGGGLTYDPQALVTVWRTTTFDESIVLPFDGVNNFNVDWGDGNVELVTTANPTHEYAEFGDHIVVCLGVATAYGSTSAVNQSKCIDIIQFGSMSILNWNSGFMSSSVTNVTATDGFSGAESTYQMFSSCSDLLSIDLSNCSNPTLTDSSFMFDASPNVISINLNGWGSNVLNITAGMFRGCSDLIVLDVGSFNMSGCLSTLQMFRDCTSITTLDVSSFDTSLVANMSEMFENCESIVTLDLSGFDTSSVDLMKEMFNDCTLLEDLDVSTWNTALVTNMATMFRDCVNLNNTDFSSWNTGLVLRTDTMFFACTSITNVDVSNFDMSSVTNAASMFGSSALSDANYDLILIAWSIQTLTSGIGISFGSAQYSAGAAATARDVLTDPPNNWVISDGGPV